MKVISYFSTGGKDLIREYINGLQVDERVDGYSVLKNMEDNRFDELTVKRWQGKVWEVYFYKHNRIFYVTMQGDKVYLLHACRKQKNKTEKTDSNIVKKRAKELETELNTKIL